MRCSKCNAELPVNAKFCLECGKQVVGENIPDDKDKNDVNKRASKRMNSKILVGGGAVFLVVIIVIISMSFGNSRTKFKNLVSKGNYIEAQKVFTEDIKDNTEHKNDIKDFIDNEAAKIYEEFANETIEYNDCIDKIDSLIELNISSNIIYKTKSKVKNLHNSRIAYQKAAEYLKDNKYGEAIEEFSNVIETDSNYEEAQLKIQENLSLLKNETIDNAKILLEQEDVDKAIEILERGLKYLNDDKDLIAQREVFEDKRIDLLKENQEVEVISTRIISDWLHDEMAEVVVQNNTNKVVKNYEVGYMAYDKNGYPVKVVFTRLFKNRIRRSKYSAEPNFWKK